MSKLITASLNVSKIDKTKLIKGEKGIYCNVIIWLNDQPDKYGNDCSIEQMTSKNESKNYLGNGKIYKQPEPKSASDEDVKDLPF